MEQFFLAAFLGGAFKTVNKFREKGTKLTLRVVTMCIIFNTLFSTILGAYAGFLFIEYYPSLKDFGYGVAGLTAMLGLNILTVLLHIDWLAIANKISDKYIDKIK